MKDILNFDRMITPSIIKFIFWIGLALIVLAVIIGGATSDDEGVTVIFSSLPLLIFGPLVLRIYCELLIIFFKIHDSLNTLKNQNQQKVS